MRRTTGWRRRELARAGRALPLACAVHCAAAPLLTVAGSMLAVPEPAELGLMAVGLAFAAVTVRCGLRRHGRRGPSGLALAGAAMWLGAHLAAGPAHWLAGTVGGLLLFGALAWDAALRDRCGCAVCRAS